VKVIREKFFNIKYFPAVGFEKDTVWLIILRIKKFLILKLGINQGGERHRKGVKLFNGVQASEKVYQSFLLEIKNKEGHSRLLNNFEDKVYFIIRLR
jgi:hypothetical protein